MIVEPCHRLTRAPTRGIKVTLGTRFVDRRWNSTPVDKGGRSGRGIDGPLRMTKGFLCCRFAQNCG